MLSVESAKGSQSGDQSKKCYCCRYKSCQYLIDNANATGEQATDERTCSSMIRAWESLLLLAASSCCAGADLFACRRSVSPAES